MKAHIWADPDDHHENIFYQETVAEFFDKEFQYQRYGTHKRKTIHVYEDYDGLYTVEIIFRDKNGRRLKQSVKKNY